MVCDVGRFEVRHAFLVLPVWSLRVVFLICFYGVSLAAQLYRRSGRGRRDLRRRWRQ
jgi:hypothetical protein